MLAVKRQRAGYTLIEMLTVLAIAAVLGSVAMPYMRSIIAHAQLNATVSDLYGAINLTRAQAIARGGRVQLVPLEPRGADWDAGWVIFVDTNGDRRPGPGEEIIASHGAIPDGITIKFNFTSNKRPYYIAFNGDGRSCSDVSSLAARWGTLSLQQDDNIRRIRINMLGRARICDPKREGATCGGASDEG